VIFGLQPWQMAYIIGGVLGLVLLLLRVSTYESGMFEHMKNNNQIKKGNFLMLFTDRERFRKYLACILIGLPVWFCIGILIKFSDKFAAIVEVVGEVKVGYAIMYAYLGLSVGDLISGLLSQLLKSRKKVVVAYLLFTIVLVFVFLFAKGLTANSYYFLCFMLGCATGYWALFVTIASEQFGTNIRATVTTTVPNFVRGAVVPIILGFKTLEMSMGAVNSALVVGGVCITLALIAIFSLKETFSKDLDYIEIS
jgi:MFS family permease